MKKLMEWMESRVAFIEKYGDEGMEINFEVDEVKSILSAIQERDKFKKALGRISRYPIDFNVKLTHDEHLMKESLITAIATKELQPK